MKKSDFKIGQQLYVLPYGRSEKLYPITIEKIGNKKLYCDRGIVVDFTNMFLIKDYGGLDKVYFSKDQYIEEQNVNKLKQEVVNKIPTDRSKLERILQIINE